jgi:hypothetical protein
MCACVRQVSISDDDEDDDEEMQDDNDYVEVIEDDEPSGYRRPQPLSRGCH